MYRPVLGFLAAALSVPILVAAIYYPTERNDTGYAVMVSASAVISFCAVFFLGGPAYLLLRARKWTAFWIAPVVGVLVAAVAWYAFNLLLALILGNGLIFTLSRLADGNALRGLLWPIGPIGALAGAILWLIARPDRAPEVPSDRA